MQFTQRETNCGDTCRDNFFILTLTGFIYQGPHYSVSQLDLPCSSMLPETGIKKMKIIQERRNREEKMLRQVAMVAKFLDDNKPIKPLKSLRYSHYFKLHRSYSISFNLANLGEIFFWTVSIVI